MNNTFDSKLISPSLFAFSSHDGYWPLFPSLVLSLPAVVFLVTNRRDKSLPCLPICNSIFPRVKCMTTFQGIFEEKGDRSFWSLLIVQHSEVLWLVVLICIRTARPIESSLFLLKMMPMSVRSFRMILNFIICNVWSRFILTMDLRF